MSITNLYHQSAELPQPESEKSLYDDLTDVAAVNVEKLAAKPSSQGSSDTPRDSPRTSIESADSVAPNAVVRTLTVADWDGPHDPENPWNWSFSKRVYQTAMTSLFGFTVYVSHTPMKPRFFDEDPFCLWWSRSRQVR
jgi:hypothetical protein